MIVVGGNCEPLSAFRHLNVPLFAGPFDWFGIPTAVFPKLITTDWWKDVCSLENIVTFSSTTAGCIGVRDLKYDVSTLHHFKRGGPSGMMNFKQAIAAQLPTFRERLSLRWLELRRILEDPSARPVVVFRDFSPPWTDPPAEGDLERACEALVEFAPLARLIIVCENRPERALEKAAVVLQNPLSQVYFKLDMSIWVPAWRFIASHQEQLEPGKIYEPGEGRSTAYATNAR
jgi:hypothetical protein